MQNDNQNLKNSLNKKPNNNNNKNNNISFQSNDKLFYIFHIHIKYVWEYLLSASFTPTFFYENCKAVNIKKSEFLEKKFSIKTIIEDIVDKEYFKSFTHKSIEVPENISHFSLKISLFFCSVHKTTGLYASVNFLDETKDKFIYDYLVENHHKVCKNIEQFIENNFKEYEQSESICIEKSSDIVWNYLISNNYYNLKILLGNNASVKATNIPNEIEVEHFTKNNKMKMVVTKIIEFNEKNLLLQVVSRQCRYPNKIFRLKLLVLIIKVVLCFLYII